MYNKVVKGHNLSYNLLLVGYRIRDDKNSHLRLSREVISLSVKTELIVLNTLIILVEIVYVVYLSDISFLVFPKQEISCLIYNLVQRKV